MWCSLASWQQHCLNEGCCWFHVQAQHGSRPAHWQLQQTLNTVSSHPALLLQVSEMKAQLSQATAQQDRLRAQASAAAAAQDAAEERANALRAEVEQLQFMLDEVHAARSASPLGKVCGQCRWGLLRLLLSISAQALCGWPELHANADHAKSYPATSSSSVLADTQW
jgi:hypothetical protein